MLALVNAVRAHSSELVAALTVLLVLFAPALEPVQLAAVSVLAFALLLVVSRDRLRSGLLALLLASGAAAVIVVVRVVTTGR
jgi:hypothetical protein